MTDLAPEMAQDGTDDEPWAEPAPDRRPSRASEVAEAAWLVLLAVVALGLIVVSWLRWWR